jgi:hypothetical protein
MVVDVRRPGPLEPIGDGNVEDVLDVPEEFLRLSPNLVVLGIVHAGKLPVSGHTSPTLFDGPPDGPASDGKVTKR